MRRTVAQIRWPLMMLGVLLGANSHASDMELDRSITNYFQQYCYGCHGVTAQKGDRRLDTIPMSVAHDDDVELLEEALDAINRGDMPPVNKDVAQPPADETRQVVSRVTEFLNQLSESSSARTTMMRRLNRFEYVNTMRDLLRLRREFFTFTSDFPTDATHDGFDNNGEALILSDYQLQRYLEVAKTSIDAASFFGIDRTDTQRWHFTGKDFNGVESYYRAPVTWRLIVDNNYLEIGHGQPSERHPNFVKAFVKQGGVPANGWYTIKVKAAAAGRLDHGYDHDEFKRFEQQPLKMALWIAPDAALLGKNAADRRQLLKVWDLPDDQPEQFTERVWLEKGAIPFLSWTNGVSSKGNIRLVAEKHHPEVIRATKTQIDAASLGDSEAIALVGKLAENEDNALLSDVYRGPRMRVWELGIEGPDFEQWPPASHQSLFGSITDASKVDIAETVTQFAHHAFRQPVGLSEIEHYIDFIHQRIENGDSHAEAIKLGMAAILTSPRFLYLDEGNEEQAPDLNPHELASRLSYFLWSSMPDDQLSAAATSGDLATRSGLVEQVDRMLRDEKSGSFVEHFTDTWLRLNTLGSMPPDPKAFAAYYRDRLEDLFKRETRMFFADLLETNGSILHLLDSDYTFVNDALATHYGIHDVKGERFQKVPLYSEHRRGGLLGQGSVLTLTANGIETSPVVRGVWVLENILGTPPPPPPPDVPAIEPDTRGTTSVRQQLEKHRDVAACADCHQKIDPLGFALEFFDPIGGFRPKYPARGDKGPPVDGFGQLPTGESFKDERGLKKLLIARKGRFASAFVKKLLVYATGRDMSFRDQSDVEQIATMGYGLRDLIIGVATSPTFRKR